MDQDLAAIYLRNREAMYRTARSALRGTGLEANVEDVVQDAIVSIMRQPLPDVRNWEAFLVTTVKRRVIDLLQSAAARHSGPEVRESDVRPPEPDFQDDVVAAVDRERYLRRLRTALTQLDDRHRQVAWDYIAMEEPRPALAAALGVTPGRISQLAGEALELLRAAMGPREEEV